MWVPLEMLGALIPRSARPIPAFRVKNINDWLKITNRTGVNKQPEIKATRKMVQAGFHA